MNKIIAHILAAVFVTAALVAVSPKVSARTYTASQNRSYISGYDEAYEAIYNAAEAGESGVDLTELRISSKDIIKIYSDVLQSSPELFYLGNTIRYTYIDRGLFKYVKYVEFTYTMSEKLRNAAVKVYENELDYILSLIDHSLSDAEKALWVHDYLVSSYSYDEDADYYDAYHFFLTRKGVCQSYSLAYIAVMRELGIETIMVSSPEMNHAWNLVRIDGEWYHVDLTFDDPSPDRAGRVLHDYFLLTDEEISSAANPHYGWKSSIECTSDAYSSLFCRDSQSRAVYCSGRWYYTSENDGVPSLTAYTYGGNAATVYRFRDKWLLDGDETKYWRGIFSGTSEFLGYIFINTPYEILLYNTSTGRINVFYENEHKDLGLIYGCTVFKNSLEYTVARSPSDSDFTLVRNGLKDFNISQTSRPFPFTDVNRLDDSYAAIRFVYDRGLFNGISATKFAPKATLTRAMFVTVLGRLCGVDPSEYDTVSFTDIASGSWYAPYVEWAARIGCVNGVGSGRFEPDGEITREQMCKIASSCADSLGIDTKTSPDDAPEFTDCGDISPWAVHGTDFCASRGLIPPGQTALRPHDKASREEAAYLIAEFSLLISRYTPDEAYA